MQKNNIGIVLVEPEYGGNVGLIARVMKNFDVQDLILVNPKTKVKSVDAIKRAMHGVDLLDKAKIVSSLDHINYDFLVGTTARTTKNNKIFRNTISLSSFSEKFRKSKGKFGLVFGSEKNGLTNEQLKACDFIITIPTGKKYPTLNLSHAVTVVLYELMRFDKKDSFAIVDKKIKQELLKQFKELMKMGGHTRNPEDTFSSFKSLIGRAIINETEANSILNVFSSVIKKTRKR